MAQKTINELTTINRASYSRAEDYLLVWDGSTDIAKKTSLNEFFASKESYLMVIESPTDNKTYTIDSRVPSARTITNVYARTASGSCSITLKNLTDATDIGTVVANSTGGSAASLANTGVLANDRLAIQVTGNLSPADLEISIEYTA